VKRAAVLLVLALLSSASASAQYYFDYPTFKRWTIGIHGGPALSLLRVATYYRDAWNDRLLISVVETSAIELRAKTGILLGVHGAFFFRPSLGIRLEVGPLASDVETSTDFSFRWTWADGRRYQSDLVWKGAGRTTTLPVIIDAVWKGALGRHEWFLTGGLAYYRHSLRADASFGYGISTMAADGSEQYVDALRVGLRLPAASWSSWGFHAGLGLSFKLSDLLGLQAEAGYFTSAAKTVGWTFVKGNYDGVLFSAIKAMSFSDGDVEFLTAGGAPRLETALRLNPSFVRLAAGLVVFLGRAEY
jgi:hypothetical protein